MFCYQCQETANCTGCTFTAEYNVLTKLTGFALTRGMLCAMKRNVLPSVEDICKHANRIAILEDVVNPTNVGAIIRSAAALGMDAVLLTHGCADPLYRRASRVSMGTVFQIPWTILPKNSWPDASMDTCDTLDKAGIRRVGAGKNLDEAKAPVILEAQGKKIGFLGASRVIPVASWNATSTKPGMLTTYDPKILVDEIKKLREQCDYLVVYVHWGIERSERPEDYQRSLGKQYIDAGADVVIGSHPHVLQGVEYYKGKPIVYSLGNFIFGSSIPKTALLKVQWDGQASQLTFVPGTSSAGYTRVLENEAQKADFASYMTGISYGVTIEDDGTVVPQG